MSFNENNLLMKISCFYSFYLCYAFENNINNNVYQKLLEL
jgi:hypothetical protein